MAPDTLTTDSFICSGDYYSVSSPSLWIIFFFLVSCDRHFLSVVELNTFYGQCVLCLI